MEKNINMQNVDELCIKYVLNELDPSELPLIEQAMREDSNVLIEVESLRSTLRKLEKLPHTAPPVNVQEKVRLLAQNTAKSRIRAKQMKVVWSGLLAAAVVVLGFGIYFYPNEASQSIAEIEVNHHLQPAQAAVATPVQQNGLFRVAASNETTKAEPWVDRQNIIRLNISVTPEGFIQMGADHQHLANTSGLRPIQEPSRPTSYPVMRDIQLTRSNR